MAPTPDYEDTSYKSHFKFEKTKWELLEQERLNKLKQSFKKSRMTFLKLKKKRK